MVFYGEVLNLECPERAFSRRIGHRPIYRINYYKSPCKGKPYRNRYCCQVYSKSAGAPQKNNLWMNSGPFLKKYNVKYDERYVWD